jgi:chromate transport protein ChrA
MFALWSIIAIVLFGVGTYSIGRFDLDGSDPAGLLWLCFIGSLLWPLVLIAIVIGGPFVGLFWLGDRKREKLKKEKSTDNK